MDKFVRVYPLHTDTQITQRVVNGIIFDSQQPEIISDFDQLKKYFFSFSDREEETKRLNHRLTVLGEENVLSIPEGENCLGIVKKNKTNKGTVVEIETIIDRWTKKPVKVRFLYDKKGKFIKVQYFVYEKPQNLEDKKGIYRDQPLFYYLQDPQIELPSTIRSIINIASVDEREHKTVIEIQKHIKNLSHLILKNSTLTPKLISILNFVLDSLGKKYKNRHSFYKELDYSFTGNYPVINFSYADTGVIPFRLKINDDSPSIEIDFGAVYGGGNDDVCYPVKEFKLVLNDKGIRFISKVDTQLVYPNLDFDSTDTTLNNQPWKILAPGVDLPPLVFNPALFINFFDGLLKRIRKKDTEVFYERRPSFPSAASFILDESRQNFLLSLTQKVEELAGEKIPSGPITSNDLSIKAAIEDKTTYLGWLSDQVKKRGGKAASYIMHTPNLSFLNIDLVFDFQKGLSANLS